MTAPTPASERLLSLDAVRGLAVLGILLVNVASMALPLVYQDAPMGETDLAWWAWAIPRFLAKNKFYPVFSALFGLGLALQAERLAARGDDGGKVLTRRLGVLAGIGLLHGMVLWYGDILLAYAAVGFLVVPLLKRSDRFLGWVAVGGVVLSTLALAGSQLALNAQVAQMDWAELRDLDLPRWARRLVRALEAGDLPALAAAEVRLVEGQGLLVRSAWRLVLWASSVTGLLTSLLPYLVGCACGGILAWRWGFFGDEGEGLRRRTLAVGLVVGVPGALAGLGLQQLGGFSALSIPGALALGVDMLSGPFLGAAYAAGVVLIARSALRPVASVLAATGRLALTHYLTHSLVFTTLAVGPPFGLSWFGAPREIWMGGVLTVWCAQLALSPLWLSVFAMGPVEWAWRWATYGVRPPVWRQG